MEDFLKRRLSWGRDLWNLDPPKEYGEVDGMLLTESGELILLILG